MNPNIHQGYAILVCCTSCAKHAADEQSIYVSIIIQKYVFDLAACIDILN